MTPVSVVYNGVCVGDHGRFFHSRSYAAFLAGLVREFGAVRYYGGFLDATDAGYQYTREAPLDIEGVELHLVRGNSPSTGSLRFVRNYLVALGRLLRFLGPATTVVIFLPSFLSVVAGLLSVLGRKSIVAYVGGNWGEEMKHRRHGGVRALFYPVNRFGIDPLVRWICRCAVATITPGYDLHARFVAEGINVHLPVPLVGVRRSDVDAREDTCRGAECRVLFVGPLRFQKGVMDLLEAVADLRPDHRLKLWYAGTGEAEAALRARAAELRMAADVVLFGHVPNGPKLFDLYRQADLFALPTYSEGFPRSLYEAMTFALPIVTTDVGGIPFFLRHRLEAYLVRPGDRQGLAAALATVTGNGELRRTLIRNARARMLEVFARAERDGNLARQIRRELQGDGSAPIGAKV